MRLIDADALDWWYKGRPIRRVIDDAPTVDAVPVVRCRDCKYYLHSNEKCELIDTRLHFYETRNRWTDDDFCAWGERKGGDE
jgi:hypothetical protein